MISKLSGIELLGVATSLPANRIRNTDFIGDFGETEVKKQIKVTGINERYYMKDPQKPTDLAISSAKKLFNELEISPSEIRLLVYVTAYTDFLIPTSSAYLKYALNIQDDCICFDVNLGCSSFLNGAYIVSVYLQQLSLGDKALLLISDTVNYGGEGKEKSTSMLSSDCGSACLFEHTDNKNEWIYQQLFDGAKYEALFRKDISSNLQMDGMAVFQFAITSVSIDLKQFLQSQNITVDSYDYSILHQAQKFIVDKVVLYSGLDKKKNLISYDKCGNSGGTSIPATICYNKEILQKKDTVKLLVSGFGSGMAWGYIFFEMKTNGICDVIYTNEHYGIERT